MAIRKLLAVVMLIALAACAEDEARSSGSIHYLNHVQKISGGKMTVEFVHDIYVHSIMLTDPDGCNIATLYLYTSSGKITPRQYYYESNVTYSDGKSSVMYIGYHTSQYNVDFVRDFRSGAGSVVTVNSVDGDRYDLTMTFVDKNLDAVVIYYKGRIRKVDSL